MRRNYPSDKTPGVATSSFSNIHSELAQTIHEHKHILRCYFDNLQQRDDVHHHLSEAVAMVKRTARQYRTESIETILQRLQNQKAA